jgi:hypothetical protein
MPIAAFLFSLTWVILGVFLLLLVRVGAKPVPTPEPSSASSELRTLSVFRVRCVLGQGPSEEQMEKRMRPHAKYHLKPLSLKTVALDTADELQSFASQAFEPQAFGLPSSPGSQSFRFTRFL